MMIPVENYGLARSVNTKNRASLAVFHWSQCLDHESRSASDEDQRLGFSIQAAPGSHLGVCWYSGHIWAN